MIRQPSYAPVHQPPDHLTAFGVWLWRRRPHVRCLGGYDDLLPMVPFLVTRWKMALVVFGHIVLRWDRHTRLGLYKHRYPGHYAGKSCITGDWS